MRASVPWKDDSTSLVRWSVEACLEAGATEIVIVTPLGETDQVARALAGLSGWRTASGGATRAKSVAAGLLALSAPPDTIVLVHDAARPFLTRAHIDKLVREVRPGRGALLAVPNADTLKRVEGPVGDVVTGTMEREGIWRAQTPQAFLLGELREAYASWPDDGSSTDEAQVFERAGGEVVLAPGDPRLFKLTHLEDFAMAEQLAAGGRATRVGQGFDAHRFGEGEAVVLCGLRIDHDRGLIGHSDADAGLHALTDALLGAIGAGDIGDHFPPSDPQWRGSPSSVFVQHAVDLVAAAGGSIVNADITLVCESPRIGPHREAMRACVADLLRIPIGAVSIKATTTEALGFTGRREGLAAQAIASVEMPR